MLNESEFSVLRPAWTSESLKACDDLYFCGIKSGYFKQSRGMPGKLLDRLSAKREGRMT